MGIFHRRGGDEAQARTVVPPEVLASWGFADPAEWTSISRSQALAIPTVRRGRNVICATIGSLPLRVARAGVADSTVEAARFVADPDPDPNITGAAMVTMSVDDLLFYGRSGWLVLARYASGTVAAARRLAPGTFSAHIDAGVRTWRVADPAAGIAAATIPDRDMIIILGPDDGILAAPDALVTARLLENTVRTYALSPRPTGILRNLSETELSQADAEGLLRTFGEQRRKNAIAYLNRSIEFQALQWNAHEIALPEAREAQALEIARLLSLPPRFVSAPDADSLTYSNTESARRELLDLTLRPYIIAIESRLSLPDVTPRGTTITFDCDDWLRSDTLARMQAHDIAIRAGIETVAEARAAEGRGAPTTPDPKETS